MSSFLLSARTRSRLAHLIICSNALLMAPAALALDIKGNILVSNLTDGVTNPSPAPRSFVIPTTLPFNQSFQAGLVLTPSNLVTASARGAVSYAPGIVRSSLEANAYSSAANAFDSVEVFTTSYVELHDTFIIQPQNPLLLNKSGTAIVQVAIDAILQGQAKQNPPTPFTTLQDARSISKWEVILRMKGTDSTGRVIGGGSNFFNRTLDLAVYDDGTRRDYDSGAKPRFLDVGFSMIFGQPVEINLLVKLESFANASDASASSFVDLGNTVAWNGITSLRDASGQLVTNYSAIAADTGFDYRSAATAVPEPSSWLLLAAGVLMLATRQMKLRVSV